MWHRTAYNDEDHTPLWPWLTGQGSYWGETFFLNQWQQVNITYLQHDGLHHLQYSVCFALSSLMSLTSLCVNRMLVLISWTSFDVSSNHVWIHDDFYEAFKNILLLLQYWNISFRCCSGSYLCASETYCSLPPISPPPSALVAYWVSVVGVVELHSCGASSVSQARLSRETHWPIVRRLNTRPVWNPE